METRLDGLNQKGCLYWIVPQNENQYTVHTWKPETCIVYLYMYCIAVKSEFQICLTADIVVVNLPWYHLAQLRPEAVSEVGFVSFALSCHKVKNRMQIGCHCFTVSVHHYHFESIDHLLYLLKMNYQFKIMTWIYF